MSRDLLADRLNSIETLIGAATTPPLQAVDKLGWHLENIKTAIESGSSGSGENASKEYVDNALNTKLDKLTTTSTNPRIYGVSENGEQSQYFATQTPDANTVPMRDASGRFQVEDGIAPKQAVNKKQLDDELKMWPV